VVSERALPFDPYAEIARHSDGFAESASRDLDAKVSGCPGWDVADLVAHLTDVHWFWSTIVAQRLTREEDVPSNPARAARDQLIERFRIGAKHLVTVLRAADQDERVWTWAPAHQNVAFITRHQVQEAAVHHWDAADAVGDQMTIAPVVAADAIAETISVSLPSAEYPADEGTEALGAPVILRCADTGDAWVFTDGLVPLTLSAEPVVGPSPTGVDELSAPAADLLLWLYRRIPLGSPTADSERLERLRAY
jgi:uncharacterized protein (TIGR03083 family)